MKKHFSLIFLFFVTLNSFAQSTISGRVLSMEDRQPLISSTITVLKAGSTELLTGTITDEDGRFSVFNLPSGEYDFLISYIGFESEKHRVIVGSLNKVLDLGNIYLKTSNVELGEISVVSQKQAVSAALDRKSYSADSFISGYTGSALDIIKTLPGVVIDQESKIILRGSDKVVILIDGKQSSLTGFGSQKGLENIPASQIESIEIINNPSAKYDAAGMAGIVNIKFKKSAVKGFTGDIGLAPGIGMITKRKADLPTGMASYSNNWKLTPSFNLNYKTEKINLYWQSYLIHQRRLPNNEFTTRFYDNGDITESQVAENRSQNHYNLKLGIDWNLTPNQTITLFGLYDYEWHIDTTRVWYFGNQDYQEPLRKWGFHESEGTGFTNITLQHKFRFRQAGHELNSQFLFTKGWEDETYDLSQDGPSPYPVINTDRTRVLAPEYVYFLTSDYIRPLSFGRLEAGFSGKLRHMPISYTMTKDPANTALIFNFGDWSEWDEDIAGGYVNLIAEFLKADIEAGLRGEYTNVKYKFAPNIYFTEDQYNYFKLFPNVRFTLKANKSNRISLFYNRRIDRPGEDILRIFPKYDDPELLKIGNPLLRPQFTQNFELAHKYIWQTGSFYTSVYHKIIDDYYTRIYIQDPLHSEITIKAYDNLGKATNSGVELTFDQKISKAWKLSVSTNVYRNKIFRHSGVINFPVPQSYSISEKTDIPFFAKMINQFTLSNGLQIEATAQYFSSKNIGQGKELSRGGIDLGIKKSLAGNKLEVNLSATDIFNTMGIRQKLDGDGFDVEYQNYYETQIFTFACKYKF
ncbi:MAG TPA: TonB-dependent receptor [Bacteroidales bacterium]|nr:TonB-dependent receptor [Bacteroidales bacterium]HOU96225.1 TonB-dependent receptor [Bacteroidales bacterium]HQG37292.1 TonB-dependent receptor [Bacteroidales bacterium]HQG52040.1 TonB-dependent receptor [Bacteroidales bacterium]HQJ21205.1 TonB-dependent receptor [Bacteroidales bacterium]